MRQIFGKLTAELSKHTTPKTVGKDPGYPIANFRELVEQVAKLSHKNKDYLLFYRGQKNDYLNKAGVSTLYPTIYRGDYLTQQELNYRFDLLNSASKLLVQEFRNRKIDGYTELARKKYIQWSVLQHYEVTWTPLLDITQSLRVACSFAQFCPLPLQSYTNFCYNINRRKRIWQNYLIKLTRMNLEKNRSYLY